jgi:hypothetical protein
MWNRPMTDREYLELVHAEIDGELDGGQRSELARRVLADPAVRAVREDLRRLCAKLDAIEDVEAPPQLRTNILQALPVSATPRTRFHWPAPRWRYAALIAGVLGATALVSETVDGPGPGSAEVAGTIAARGAPRTLDTVALGAGPVAGRVSLYRDGGGLGVAFELAASAPVDVLIANDGHTIRVNGLGRTGTAKQRTTVALPGSGTDGSGVVELTLLMSGREVGRATLTVPAEH